jgi:hypothetical protein
MTDATPAIVNPVQDYGQLDYRSSPSASSMRPGHPYGTYDHPNGADWSQIEPWTDQTWQSFDAQDDAYRFRGINTPEQQAQLHLAPDPASDAHGWSPDLAPQLQWERAVDGSPPP